MARDQIEVDLLLNAKKAEATIKQMNRELGKMGKTMGQAFSGTGGGASNNVRALGTGLSKATVRADEFSKSLEASNARVIAFGASAGLIMNVDRALRAMVKTTIQVEKAMADVNVVMNVSNKQLEQFGKGMFKVAKETAQGFSTVAEASTELARQGLGMEKTLARTKDALILTRLTGMNAADAVKSLTAAVNSFSKEGATSAQVVNRMAKVDAQFAVSSEDLAKSISRVGASAQSAGVSMNELMAITTAVQQRTARGGAVIGNAFKTIFTRIQRSDVQQKLENLGVATRSMSGEMLSGIQVLQNLAKNFDSLSKAQQSSTAESVAGVFQVNILKSALADLSQQNSAYAGALRAANTATDEAYRKNEKLNQSLDSLVNKTMANLVQAGSALGGNIFGPAISNVLNTVNATIEAFSEGGKFESFGEGIGKNLVKGIGKFIGGPGLIIATAVFAKLTLSLSKFATTAFKDIMGINTAVKQRAALEEIVVNTLASEPALLQKVKMGTLSVLDVEKQILATIKQQQVERAALKGYGGAVAGSLYQRGTRVGSSGRAFSKGMGRMGRASGFVPNFANANSERAAAAAGGYTAGAIKTMSQPGAGTMMYNSAETVKQFPGMSQKAIMPPSNSSAGANYRSTFGAAHGFDPYAAGGFVPNFSATALFAQRAATVRSQQFGDKGAMGLRDPKTGGKSASVTGKSITAKKTKEILAAGGHLSTNKIAMLVPHGKNSTGIGHSPKGKPPFQNFSATFPVYEWSPERIRLEGNKRGQVADASEMMLDAAVKITKSFAGKVRPPADDKLIQNDNTKARLLKTGGGKGAIDGAAGAVFEAGMSLALGMRAAAQDSGQARGDFDLRPKPFGGNASAQAWGASMSMFGGKFNIADFKISASDSSRTSMASKIGKELINRGPGASLIRHTPGKRMGSGGKPLKAGKAGGFIPNFSSPLGSSVGRELAAGVPASAIRVGSSSSLRSSGNPGGLGVYNTIDEPAGLTQGINRSRSAGINPKTHGVPNFAIGGILARAALRGGGSALSTAGMVGGMSMLGGSDSLMGSMASYGMMGMGGGFMGIGAGAVLGALIHGLGKLAEEFDFLGLGSDEATERLKEQTQAQNKLKEASQDIASELDKSTAAMQKNALEVAKSKQASLLRSQGLTDDFEVMKKLSGATTRAQFNTAVAEGEEMSAVVRKVVGKGADNFRKTSGTKATQRGFIGNDIPRFGDGGFAPEERGLLINSGISDFYGITPMGVAQNLTKRAGGNYPQAGMLAKGVMHQVGTAPLLGNTSSSDMAKSLSNVIARQLNLPQSATENIQTDLLSKARVMAADPELASQFPSKDEEVRVQHSLMQMSEELALVFNDAVDEIDNLRESVQKSDEIIKESANANRENIRSLLMLKRHFMDLGSVAKLNHGLEMQKIRQAKAALDLDNRLKMSQKASSRTVYEVIYAQQEQAKETAEFNRDKTYDAAKATRVRDTAGVSLEAQTSAVDNVLKLFSEGKLAGQGALDRTAAGKAAAGNVRSYATLFGRTNTEGSDFMLQSMLEKRTALSAKQSVEGATMSFDEAADLAALEAIIPKFVKIRNTEYREREIAAQKAKDDAILAKKTHDLKIQEYNNQFELNTKQRQLDRVKRAGLTGQTLGEAEGLFSSGQIGARERNAAFSASLAADVGARGVQKGDVGRAFRAGFINEFDYGPVDELRDFENGSRQVAQTMKSSFADAFSSITSGATSVKGALANMAQSILDSISQVSSNMFANMMMSKMFGGNSQGNFAQGGYVQGYNSGGLISGGSGYKDDVPIRATGGEFVIKKSAVNKIGLPTLNSINGMANGGMSMGKMALVSAGASAASGLIGSAMQPGAPDVPRSQNYGMGRSKHGYLGGADPDAGGSDMISGRGGRASVSLNKAYAYYRRDPQTGQLISERARPTEGRFEVSDNLSLLGRLGEDDPQTARMFQKEQAMSKYQGYLSEETDRRKAAVKAVKRQKRGRLIQAYANAAMLIGGAKFGQMGQVAGSAGAQALPAGFDGPPAPGTEGGTYAPMKSWGPMRDGYVGNQNSRYANGGMIATMGGEYIMSPEAVRTHGINFMTELNRGNAPGYASGGLVGSAPADSGSVAGGNTTNNVSISVNIDKNGKASADSSAASQQGGESAKDQQYEIDNNKELGQVLKAVVLQEMVKQQRPGGLLNRSTTGVG